MYTKKEREQYNQSRDNACQRLGITKNQYNWLRRKGEELRRIYEANCNGDSDYKINGMRENGLNNDIQDYIGSMGLFIYFQTDPRGATLYLDKKPIPTNNYTQAVCIY